MNWFDLVEQMHSVGFSPGEALIMATLTVFVARLTRRVQRVEQELGAVRHVLGLKPINAHEGEPHG